MAPAVAAIPLLGAAGGIGLAAAKGPSALNSFKKAFALSPPTLVPAAKAAPIPDKLGKDLAQPTSNISPGNDILNQQLQAAFAGLSPFSSAMPLAYTPALT